MQLSSRLETYFLKLVTNVVASEMRRLALPLLDSKSFDSVASPQYSMDVPLTLGKKKSNLWWVSGLG